MNATLCILLLTIGIVALLLFGSCTTTRYVPGPVRTDTVWGSHTAHDSIYVRDSIWVSQMQQGDTIYIEKVKWKTVWGNHTAHDTVYKATHDTVTVAVDVPAGEPQGTLTWWQRLRISIANVVLYALLIALLLWIVKREIRR